ncbi:CHASE2 and HATPase_c domain-containing protein [Xenophilus sp. Marseille-Q4582]|uniref:CHASE2 and HATPase_c domain-containing protein n=1 Tax=Xenophilus sp. Marseille-Q4582 TaxID=2866600 RepID=UPI001CE46476|nr:CHASE2 and HATPase_c domain-containing protein [Xenophilus sp. Marseille-Q4582]
MRRRTAKRRVLLEWLLLAGLLPLLMLVLAERPELQQLDGRVQDRLLQALPAAPADGQVRVVVDRASLDALGPWPWPQATHAQLLQALAPHQPRSVLLDVDLGGPASADAPDALAAALSRLPVYLVQREAVGASEPQLLPLPPALAAAAAGVGHARLVPGPDGVVRTLYAQEGRPGRLVPYVGWLLAHQRPAEDRPEAAPLQDAAGAWQRRGPFSFARANEAGRAPTLSYVQVLRGEVPAAQLRGRDVLVGLGADAGLGDLWAVSSGHPSSLRVPGVAVHAQAIAALRAGRTVAPVQGWPRRLWIVLPLLAGLCFFPRRERQAALGALALGALCVLASAGLLLALRLWLSPVAPVLGLWAGCLLWRWRRQSLMLAAFRRQLARLHDGLRAGEPPLDPRMQGPLTLEQQLLALDDAVQRLQSLQRLFRQGLRDLPVAVLLCGRDGTVRHANPAARQLLRLHRRRDAHGRLQRMALPAILDRLRPAGAAPPPEGHWATVHQGAVYQRAGFVFRVRCTPLGGRAHGWAVVLDDLTAEHRMQAERAQWLRFLSHDLRSPQVNILSRVALDERAHPDAPGRAELAAAVRREVERTLALAEGFMDLGQAEAGDFTQGEVLVEAAAGDAADQVWAYAESRGVRIEVRAPAGTETFVRGNAGLLVRAVVNLLNNAIRHSAAGSAVRLCIGVNGGEVLLMVSDAGEGMSAAQVRRLRGWLEPGGAWPPGRPAAAAQGRASAGAAGAAAPPVRARGLGLAVVWAVVQRHGGWVDLWSAPGAGSSFVIALPLLAVDEATTLRAETLF